MQTELLTIAVEHLLVMRGLPAQDMQNSIVYAERVIAAPDADAVADVLDAMLEDFGLPVEDTLEVAEQFHAYVGALA